MWLIALMVALLLTGCSADQAAQDSLNGRILLWHAWSESEAAALAEALSRFEGTEPGVTVMVQTFDSEDALLEEYQQASDAGLGPDILIGPSSWLRPLADDSLIADINDRVNDQLLERYMPAAVASLIYDDRLYGLPQSLDTMALFFNRREVDRPAETLEELLQQAAAGNVTIMGTGFQDAFWGIQAFGGQLFDDEGRVILDQGGFANWLAWLKEAREAPGMILDANHGALYDRFVADRTAYYIGRSSELGALTEALGDDLIGVAPLPSGPTGPAGPLLDVQAFYFNPVSSHDQSDVALALARFLTNSEQSGALMRAAKHVPANTQVRINPRLDPVVNSLAIQARTAVPALNSAHIDAVWPVMADLYPKALEGVLDPAEAVTQATEAINQANGIPPRVAAGPVCTIQGNLRVAVVDDDVLARFFQEQADRFPTVCPNADIEIVALPALNLANPTQPELSELAEYHLILGSQTLLPMLADGGHIQVLEGEIDPDLLQRFRPIAISGLRYEDLLYGLPVFIDTSILYYDHSLLQAPARTLTDLDIQAEQGIPIVINTEAANAFWGIGAFAGQLFNEGVDADKFEIGLVEWLTWLRASRQQSILSVEEDDRQAQAMFVDGRSAYYVGDSRVLPALFDRIGADNLGIALLPSGPVGAAQPLVWATGFMFGTANSEQEDALAIAFIEETTDVRNQERLWAGTHRLPSNAGVESSDEASLSVFLAQAASTVAVPNRVDLVDLFEEMGNVYDAVLNRDVEPQDAVADFVRQFAREETSESNQEGEGQEN